MYVCMIYLYAFIFMHNICMFMFIYVFLYMFLIKKFTSRYYCFFLHILNSFCIKVSFFSMICSLVH